MSWQASRHIKKLRECPTGGRLNTSEKCVALVLADYHQIGAKKDTFPSIETIAEDAEMGLRNCKYILKALETKGVIVRVYPPAQGRGSTVFYEFPGLMTEQKAISEQDIERVQRGVTASTTSDEKGAMERQQGCNVTSTRVQCDVNKGAMERSHNRMNDLNDLNDEERFSSPASPVPEKPLSQPFSVLEKDKPPHEKRKPGALKRRPSSVITEAWVPRDSWNAFLDAEFANRRGATFGRQHALLQKLKELRDRGNDPAAVINQAIAGRYPSFVDVIGGINGAPRNRSQAVQDSIVDAKSRAKEQVDRRAGGFGPGAERADDAYAPRLTS